MSAKPALGGGLWITFAGTPADPTQHYQFFWRGGYGGINTVAPYTPFSVITKTTNASWDPVTTSGSAKSLSKTISLNSVSNLSVGMFVFATTNNYYIGTIKSIDTVNSRITLEKFPFLWDSTSNNNATLPSISSGLTLNFYSLRPYLKVHGRGLINIAATNTTVVTGGALGTSAEAHWLSAGLDSGEWALYRASDNAFLGKVSSVTDNLTLSLHANANIKFNGDEYIAYKYANPVNMTTASSSIVTNRSSSDFAGLYTAVYAGYQWYGNFAKEDQNINRVVFSASHDREAVDLSVDAADSIIFPGKSQFRGLGASSAGLLVFLEDRTYILRGNDRTNFSVEQLVPEGCLCASSIVEYGGGVFWAGKSGIMFFDGASVRNLTKDNLGLYYTDSLDNFNPELDRVMGFIHKNNLVMTFTSWTSPFDPIRYEPIYAADWLTTDGIK